MAIIYTYPQKNSLSPSDRIVLSDADDEFTTKYATIQQLIDVIPGYVPGAGTVTEVAATTSMSGLSFSGSPIQTNGTLNLEGTLGVTSGGTSSTTALDAIITLTRAQAETKFPGVLQVYSDTQGPSVRWTQDYLASLTIEPTIADSTGNGITIDKNSGEVTLTQHIFKGQSNVGFVPPITGDNQPQRFLNGQGNWVIPSTNSYQLFTIQSPGLVNANTSVTGKFLRDDGSWAAPANTSYPVFSAGVNGLVPGVNSTGTGNKYLADNAQWKEVAGTENLGITPLDIYQGKKAVDVENKVVMVQTISDTTFFCNYIHFACLNTPETGEINFAIYKGDFSATQPVFKASYSFDITESGYAGSVLKCATIEQNIDSFQMECGAPYLIAVSSNADVDLLGIDDGVQNNQIAVTKSGFFSLGGK